MNRAYELLIDTKDLLVQWMGNVKVTAAIGAGGFSVGLSEVIGLIPDNIGKVTSVFALLLLLINMNIQRKNSILKDIEIEHARLNLQDRRKNPRRTVDEVNPHGE